VNLPTLVAGSTACSAATDVAVQPRTRTRHRANVTAANDRAAAVQPESAVRVLLVEDESAVAYSLKRGLELEGFQVEWVADGETALARARTGSYEAILLDRVLPGLSGDRVLELLNGTGNRTPVAMVTGYPDTESAHRAGLFRAAAYLEKGRITVAGLAAAVRTAIEGETPAAQVASEQSASEKGGRAAAVADLAAWLRQTRAGDPAELVRMMARVLIDPDLTLEEFVAVASSLRLLHEKARLPFSVLRSAILLKIEQSSNPAVFGQVRHRRLGPAMRRAALELGTSREYVSQIAYGVGYSDHANFDHDFKLFFGITPGAFRRLL
jgi:DNA-binding response OmpR family regulator